MIVTTQSTREPRKIRMDGINNQRLRAVATQATRALPAALRELNAGRKKGHWVWWVFPTLFVRGGDMNSALQRGSNGEPLGPTGADLASASEAAAYLAHKELRSGLLEAFTTADHAMAKHGTEQAPWKLLDAGFGRQADGVWIKGPVDAYKLWCSATLFAAVAHQQGDVEMRRAAVGALRHFTGDVKYTPAGEGTAGHVPGFAAKQQPTHALVAPDQGTLDLVAAQSGEPPVDWHALVEAVGPLG